MCMRPVCYSTACSREAHDLAYKIDSLLSLCARPFCCLYNALENIDSEASSNRMLNLGAPALSCCFFEAVSILPKSVTSWTAWQPVNASFFVAPRLLCAMPIFKGCRKYTREGRKEREAEVKHRSLNILIIN